jgi:hypothetical protein
MMREHRIIRGLCAAAGIVVLAGCAAKPVPLYMWESFPHQQYDVLMHESASADDQIHAMEEHANKARATNAALPPGFRAHLGMLELQVGHAQRARELFESEKAAFPESAPYMDRLLAKLGAPAQAAQPETKKESAA